MLCTDNQRQVTNFVPCNPLRNRAKHGFFVNQLLLPYLKCNFCKRNAVLTVRFSFVEGNLIHVHALFSYHCRCRCRTHILQGKTLRVLMFKFLGNFIFLEIN